MAADSQHSDNVYVTGMPASMDEYLLRQVFAPYATIVQCRVLPSSSPEQKAAALVRFSTPAEASWIIQNMNGNVPQGLSEPIQVRLADSQDGKPGKGSGNNRYAPYEVAREAAQRSAGRRDGGQFTDLPRSRGRQEGVARPAPPHSTRAARVPPPVRGKGSGKGSGNNRYAPYEGGSTSSHGNVSSGYGGPSHGGGGTGGGGDNLYVTNLPAGSDCSAIEQIFSAYGTVKQCMVLSSTAPGHKCAALVRFATADEASYILQALNGQTPPGCDAPLHIKPAEGRPGGHGGDGHGDKAPSDNLYVSNLPRGTDVALLKTVFGPYGTIMQTKILPPTSGQTHAAALVRFSSVAEASNVLKALNGQTLPVLTEPLHVKYADNPQVKGQRDSHHSPGSGMPITMQQICIAFEQSGALPGTSKFTNDENTLYVAGLPPDTEDTHLYRLFASFGSIGPKGVKAVANPDGTCKGFGFVNFLDASSVDAAIQTYNGAVLPDGTVMKVSFKTPKTALAVSAASALQVAAASPALLASLASAAATAAEGNGSALQVSADKTREDTERQRKPGREDTERQRKPGASRAAPRRTRHRKPGVVASADNPREDPSGSPVCFACGSTVAAHLGFEFCPLCKSTQIRPAAPPEPAASAAGPDESPADSPADSPIGSPRSSPSQSEPALPVPEPDAQPV